MYWLYFAFFTCGIVIFGAIYQFIHEKLDDHLYPPTGQFIDVGGFRLHYNYYPNSGPTVVFDAGLAGTSLSWALVVEEVKKFAGVFSYDRAGYAWSEKSPRERTSLNIVEELHTLLKKANIPGPYLLVGHSFGGANMLLFADRYPDETYGIILVDSVHEDMLEKFPTDKPSFWSDYPKIKWLLAFSGVNRMIGPSKMIKEMFAPLPSDVQNSYIAQINKMSYFDAVSSEYYSFRESLKQLKQADGFFKNHPLIVITAGHVELAKNEVEGKTPPKSTERVWAHLQKELVSKSSLGKQMIARNSNHMINHHEPQIIVKAVKEMRGRAAQCR